MANTATNVTTGKPKITGGVYRAPLGTTLPTDASTALAGAFVSLGYISDDGVVKNIALESTEYYDWGGDPVLTEQTSKKETWSFNLIEALNKTTYEVVYGSQNVSGTLSSGISVSSNGKDTGEFVYVIEQSLRGGAMQRTVIPDGMISEIGDINYKRGELIKYPVKISGLADSSGNTSYEYIKKAAST